MAGEAKGLGGKALGGAVGLAKNGAQTLKRQTSNMSAVMQGGAVMQHQVISDAARTFPPLPPYPYFNPYPYPYPYR